MPSAREQEGLWEPDASESGMESFNGLELAEAPTAPARLEDQPDLRAQEGNPNPAPEAAERSTADVTPPAGRRGRGGRPRVTGDQDQRIMEVFEKAKEEGRSLKEAAQELAKELGQPAEYINQRYYYLRRRSPQPEGAAAAQPAVGGRRRETARAAEAPAPRAMARGGRRVAAAARAAEAEAPAAPPAREARRRGRGAAVAVAPGVEQRLAELSDIATRQLGALTERMERIEERLSALERRPAAKEVGDEELYSRLGRMLVRAAFGAFESGRG